MNTVVRLTLNLSKHAILRCANYPPFQLRFLDGLYQG